MESCKLYAQHSPYLFGVQGYMLYSTVLTRLQCLQPSRAVLSMVLLPSVPRVLLNVSSVQNPFWRTFLQLSRQKNRGTGKLKKKKNSHTFSQIRRKLGKMKFLWDWRDGSVLKSTCCFAEGSGWVPRALLVEHNGRSSSSKGSFHLFQPWWALHAGGTHTYMQKNARMT